MILLILVMSLPNFSNENGAVAAVQNVEKPIFIQAYPDEIGKMDFEHRRIHIVESFL